MFYRHLYLVLFVNTQYSFLAATLQISQKVQWQKVPIHLKFTMAKQRSTFKVPTHLKFTMAKQRSTFKLEIQL